MNLIALILIALATTIELAQALAIPAVTRRYVRLHPLALGCFFTGFILYVMFHFWIISLVGHGSIT